MCKNAEEPVNMEYERKHVHYWKGGTYREQKSCKCACTHPQFHLVFIYKEKAKEINFQCLYNSNCRRRTFTTNAHQAHFQLIPTHNSNWFPPPYPINANPQFQLVPTHISNSCQLIYNNKRGKNVSEN